MNVQDYLQRRHAIEVLKTVNENPGIIQKKLADKSKPGSTAKQERIKEAIELRLIFTKDSADHWSAITYYTTDRGKELCERLSHIDDDLDSSSNVKEVQSIESVDNNPDLNYIESKFGCQILISLLNTPGLTAAQLESKYDPAEVKKRISEAIKLDLVIANGSGPDTKYILTVDGNNFTKNILNSIERKDVIELDYETSPTEGNTVR